MARQILRIRDLGQSTFWQLMQMEGQPAPLTGKTALLLAADGADTQDVLAATAAARQLGMDVDMLPPALWAQDMASCDLQAPLYAHAGLCLTAGLKGGALDCLAAGLPGAVVNAGNDKGAPGQALADLALLAARHGDWESLRIAWLGGAQCGLACDLITAAIYAPFELFMALPEWGEPDRSLLDMALRAGAKIFLSRVIPVDGVNLLPLLLGNGYGLDRADAFGTRLKIRILDLPIFGIPASALVYPEFFRHRMLHRTGILPPHPVVRNPAVLRS